MLRVVLDTDVIISGTIRKGGSSGKILRAWRQRRFLVVTSASLIAEVRRGFTYPRIREYGISGSQTERVLTTLFRYGIVTPDKLNITVIEEDPADNLVLSAAVEGGAQYIVTGDLHIKKLHRYRGIRIITPPEFLPF